ncbi:MAG: Nre family DNA repair protein [Candidatus Aenigmatarchaeota archaeon]|nr:Nre family DNA repair protein [Candidatus Aenigmarchaeota archaeon]
MFSDKPNICPACNSNIWSHKSNCPVLKRILLQHKLKQNYIKKELFGSTPPSIIVGEWNYPKVNVGILLPNETGNTTIYDSPKEWYKQKFTIEDVFNLRLKLYNAKNTFDKKINDKKIETIQEIAAASMPTDTEIKLSKNPFFALHLNPFTAPYGPTGDFEQIKIVENTKIDRKVDYIISDVDLKAEQAVKILYDDYDVYNITKLLSAGLLGVKKQRKLVPTRWAITAIDSILIKDMLRSIKQFDSISDHMLFQSNYMGNYFNILLIPEKWMFEVIEIAVPGATWMSSKNPIIVNDYEFYEGRKDYAADVAGGYYAAELAILEYLSSIKKQAGVLVVREIRPEYYAPVGVWKVRECIRDAFSKKPLVIKGIDEFFEIVDKQFIIKSDEWKRKSKILQFIKNQKRIFSFLK